MQKPESIEWMKQDGRKRRNTVLCLKQFSAALKDWIIAMPVPQNSSIVLINLFKSVSSQKGKAGVSVTGTLSTQNW